MCLPLLIFTCTIKSRGFSSGSGSPGWSRNKGYKTVVVVVSVLIFAMLFMCNSGSVKQVFFCADHELSKYTWRIRFNPN